MADIFFSSKRPRKIPLDRKEKVAYNRVLGTIYNKLKRAGINGDQCKKLLKYLEWLEQQTFTAEDNLRSMSGLVNALILDIGAIFPDTEELESKQETLRVLLQRYVDIEEYTNSHKTIAANITRLIQTIDKYKLMKAALIKEDNEGDEEDEDDLIS